MLKQPGGRPTKSGRGPHKTAAGRLPVKCLSDFFPRHKFELVSVSKPSDNTSGKEFNVSLTLPSKNNIEFSGKGRLEKLAKNVAATAALKFFEIPGSEKMIRYTLPSDTQRDLQVEGISDVVGYVIRIFGPGVKFTEPVQIHVNKTPLWKASVAVQGYNFEEFASSKKKAKEAVAITCIKTLKNRDVNIVVPTLKAATFEDSLMELMYKTLKEKTHGLPKSLLRFRNMAGIYLHDTKHAEVKRSGLIAVATGGDTINSDGLISTGTVLHDCNAEILALRAFKLALYNQINNLIVHDTHSSNELFVEKDVESGLFKLKDNYRVMMILNHPPSGDALVFNSLPKRANIKHILNCQQDKPGALQYAIPIIKSGQPKGLKFVCDTHFQVDTGRYKPAFVSPADKLTLRNIVGIQGGLLSQLMLPVFVTKYVLQKTVAVCQDVLKRSFYERIEQHLIDIPPPFQVNNPEFVTASSKLPVDKMYGKFAGWVDCQNTENSWEVIKLPEGKALSQIPRLSMQNSSESDIDFFKRKLEVAKEIERLLVPSMLCKSRFFEKFNAALKGLGKDIPLSYCVGKVNAATYQIAKLKVKQAFADAGLGNWPLKPADTGNLNSLTSE
ncbi:double-stranded RNA-specific editase B2-like [Bolinopsis microptera]|uniref:double-stranded RNA-specific editase B2-like n=1 Tax=Bolinopsis microptera TaxID=2820187 RepID=UPI00307A7E31